MGSLAQDPVKERLALLAENARLRNAVRALLPIAVLGLADLERLGCCEMEPGRREMWRSDAMDAAVIIAGARELVGE